MMKNEITKILIVILLWIIFYLAENRHINLVKFFRKPNIILMSIDTLRADHLSCYGYSKKTSPNIDKFANDAVIFKGAISQAPGTAPTHMSLFTGLPASVHNIDNFERPTKDEKISGRIRYEPLNKNIKTLAETLSENGYMAIGFHGGDYVSGRLGFNKGFDKYSPAWSFIYQNPKQIDEVRNIISQSKKAHKPLFLFLHHYICHSPYINCPEEYRGYFLHDRVEGLPFYHRDLAASNDWTVKAKSFWDKVDLSNPRHRDHVVSLYDGCILYSDYIFGEVIKILKEEGFYDNSIIVLLSDHGEEFYEHGGKMHGRLFIEILHVPFIIKFPNNRYSGLKINRWVRTFDLMPTLFDFLGIREKKHFMQAVSLMPLLTKKGMYKPLIVSYSSNGAKIRFIKDGFAYSNQPSHGTEEWLFDEKSDPNEMSNLANINVDIVKKMRGLAETILERDKMLKTKLGYEPPLIVENDKELLEQLKALGYVN